MRLSTDQLLCETDPVAEDDETSQNPWVGEAAEQVYANVVMTAAGPFDVALVFGYQDYTRHAPDTLPATHEVARVAMSWGHLKSMIPLMARLVAQYETQVGEIPAPGFEENWKE